jgi:quercetin dioxygenase-like cupin family protein
MLRIDRKKWAALATVILFGVFGICVAAARRSADSLQSKEAAKARIAFSQALPKMDGDHLKSTVVEVSYGPGGSSPAHSHPCPVIGYVIEGALRTKVDGEAEAIYKAGQTFYEAPNGVHRVSANASDKDTVRFIAYFVCDHDAPLMVAPPEAKTSGGR